MSFIDPGHYLHAPLPVQAFINGQGVNFVSDKGFYNFLFRSSDQWFLWGGNHKPEIWVMWRIEEILVDNFVVLCWRNYKLMIGLYIQRQMSLYILCALLLTLTTKFWNFSRTKNETFLSYKCYKLIQKYEKS